MAANVSFGDYKPSKVFDNQIFSACIQFYRSKEHSKRKYGNLDKSYKGEFGFDKFDDKVCAEGLLSEYQSLDTIIPKEETINDIRKYLCAYLSIWPPNVEGNLDNKKSTVTLYVKAEKGTIELGKSSDIEFTSTNKNIIIVGNTLNLTIDGDAKPLTIECKGAFENDVTIEARAVGEFQVLGKLIIKANAIRYKTIIQPVELSFGTDKILTDHNIHHTNFIVNLVKEFNYNSFNQAYIYGELAPTTKRIVLKIEEFLNEKLLSFKDETNLYLKKDSEADDATRYYNNKIEDNYFSSITSKKNKQAAKEKLQNTIRDFYIQFDKKFSFSQNSKLKYILKKYKEKVLTTAWDDPNVQKAYKDYQGAKSDYKEFPNDEINLNKEKKLHIFYTKDIHGAKNPTDKVIAYSELASGVAHIFDSALTNPDAFTTILHELGHSLGLNHTFDKNLGTYKLKEPNKRYEDDVLNDIDKLEGKNGKIDQLEAEKKKLIEASKIAQQENLNPNEVFVLKQLQMRYNLIQKAIEVKNVDINYFEKIFLDMLLLGPDGKSGTIKMESNPLNTATDNSNLTINKIDDEIKIAKEKLALLKMEKKNIQEAKILDKFQKKTRTKENFMDYNQSSNGNIETSFERKSFYQWQWKEMQNTGIQNRFLEKIK